MQLPQAPWTWIRAGDRHQPWIIGVPRTPGRRPCRRTPRQSRPPLRSSERLPETSVSLPGITLSDKEVKENAHTAAIGAGIGSMPIRTWFAQWCTFWVPASRRHRGSLAYFPGPVLGSSLWSSRTPDW